MPLPSFYQVEVFQTHFCGIMKIITTIDWRQTYMTNTIENTLVILQERMAGWLMFNGFGKVTEKLDLKNPNRKIFIFNDSPELRETMGKYAVYKELLDK